MTADARVNVVRGIDLAVRDLAASVDFYQKAWGLEEASREGSTVYLRATGPEHHVLALHEAPKTAFLGSRLGAPDKAAVDALYNRAKGFGVTVTSMPGVLPAAAGGGYGYSFRTPDGIEQSVSCDVAAHADVIDDNKRPQKFSHVVLRAANYPELRSFYCDLLGFKLSDETDGINFLRCSPDHHSVALAKAEGPGLHHMAFEMKDLDSLLYAVGRLRHSGCNLEWGIGRHSGPGNNVFSFFVEPNGFAAELTTEMDQIDDATYPVRTKEWWRENRPYNGPCAWGVATKRSDLLHLARSGTLLAERNACDTVISQALAS